MTGEANLTASYLRESLMAFWGEALAIEPRKDGFLFTMPASFPDGRQIVLEITQPTPHNYRLSDRGQTLSWLVGRGQNVETDSMKGHIARICAEYHLQEDGGEFYRWLSFPLDATDVHVFTEGLISISQLQLFHDHRAAEENVADTVVQRIFHDAGLHPKRNHGLHITKDRKIQVDYYVLAEHPVAVQLLKAKSDISGNMEKWGFRWHELKKAHHGLMPVMLYDRNTQLIDAYSRHIGETECKLFCGYDETDRIHQVLNKSR